MRAISAGNGSAVVSAHGFGATSAEWNIVWDALVARGFRLITFDQRGHGLSTLGSDGSGSAAMAGDCTAVLEHFNVRDGVLVGHSMGGFVAIRAVLDDPAISRHLCGLVLVATWTGRVLDGAPRNWLPVASPSDDVAAVIAASRETNRTGLQHEGPMLAVVVHQRAVLWPVEQEAPGFEDKAFTPCGLMSMIGAVGECRRRCAFAVVVPHNVDRASCGLVARSSAGNGGIPSRSREASSGRAR